MIGVIKGTMRQKKEVTGLPLPIASYKANLKAPIRSLKVAITAKQSGSGTPSPDNIRPISGASECNVVDMSDITNIDYFQGLLAGTYGFVDGGTLSWSYGNGGFMASLPNSTASTVMEDRLKVICPRYTTPTTIPSSYTDVPDKSIFKIYNQANVYIKDTNYLSTPSFKASMSGVYIIYELATATTPTITTEQFNSLLTAFGISGWCVNIALGDTYYGGSLDVTNGVLTVTHKLVSGDIFITPQNNTAGTGTVCYILASNTDFKVPSNFCKSNILKGSSENWNNLPANSYSLSNSTYIVVCSNTPNQTRAQFIEWFNDNVQMLLELATPITVQLTPTQIEQLLGVNNVFADCGDVEELIYTDRQVYYGR